MLKSRCVRASLLTAALLAAAALEALTAAAQEPPAKEKAKAGPSHIRLASWNISKLGANDKEEYNRSVLGLVNILRKTNADLICLQGLSAEGYREDATEIAKEQLRRLVNLLNRAASHDGTPSYNFSLCKGQGGEAAAFLWRRPVSLQGEPKPLEERERGGDDGPNYRRPPSLALFSAGKTDFYVVSCHLTESLAEGRMKGQAEEYTALAEWLRKLEGQEEKDAVVLGTFNRFAASKAPWATFWTAADDGHFRLPLMEAIRVAEKKFDPAQDEAPLPRYGTSVGRKATLRNQIAISRGLTTEFRAAAPKFGEDVGIVDFDNDDQYQWAVGDWNDAASLLSDHRPIWIRLAIDQGDDD